MYVQYSETTTSGLSTVTDPGLVEALHDLAVALAVWQRQAAADFDVWAMGDAGDDVLERLVTATNAAIAAEVIGFASR
jgi:hypothetical protein